MKPAIALLSFPFLLAGCDADCEDFDRMDGTYAVWQAINNSAESGAATPLTISAGYPTQELFINGWTRWKISYQASNGGLNIVMTDVLEKTDLPGEVKVFSAVPLSGTMKADDSNCNVFDIKIEDSYEAELSDKEGVFVTQNVHSFLYDAHLVYYGDHLSGTFTYSDSFSGMDHDGAAMEGKIEGVTGSFIGTLKSDDDFDTGF